MANFENLPLKIPLLRGRYIIPFVLPLKKNGFLKNLIKVAGVFLGDYKVRYNEGERRQVKLLNKLIM